MANPSKEHWNDVKWIFRYLWGMSNAYLQFGRTREALIGYVDSYFAADLDKRRSLTGYVFTIGGYAISWRACLQPTVAQSTIEAEYIAVCDACKEVVWLNGLYAKLSGDYLALIYFVTVKVLYISQKIKCFMREQSALMSSIIMSEK
jgi:hypothetical protein